MVFNKKYKCCSTTNIEELWRSCEKQWAMIPAPKVKKSLSKHSYEDLRGFKEERTEYTLLITCVVIGSEVSSSKKCIFEFIM